MIKKIFKWFVLSLLLIVTVISIGGAIFMNTSPQFGGVSSEKDIVRYKELGRYKDGIFVNEIPTSLDMSFGDMVEVLGDFIKGVEKSEPNPQLKIIKTDSASVATLKQSAQVLWFGHSTVLLQIEGMNVVLDPMMGLVPAPHELLGKKRYSRELPLEIKELPEVDAVIISHDHYDHLDYGSIVRIKNKVKHFYCPLGVGAHLLSWGVKAEKIHELNWWDSSKLGDLEFVLTPSRHFSGRGLTDRFKTLWGSWVVKGTKDRIFFSGDGGYGPHFKKIGEKHGPFDLAFIECGQYNAKWKQIHMVPEESAQAGMDLKAKVIFPIHWAAFSLALHSWTDPIERIMIRAKELNIPVATPQIGELVPLDSLVNKREQWWKNYND